MQRRKYKKVPKRVFSPGSALLANVLRAEPRHFEENLSTPNIPNKCYRSFLQHFRAAFVYISLFDFQIIYCQFFFIPLLVKCIQTIDQALKWEKTKPKCSMPEIKSYSNTE